jgi:hypothetical protein
MGGRKGKERIENTDRGDEGEGYRIQIQGEERKGTEATNPRQRKERNRGYKSKAKKRREDEIQIQVEIDKGKKDQRNTNRRADMMTQS